MFLSGKAIEHAVLNGDLGIVPFDTSNLKGASYTLTLSPKLKIVETSTEIEIPTEGFVLEPGTFILGFTNEKLSLRDKYVCFLSARGSCAQIGMNILLGSYLAEPDTDGIQILEIHNVSASPIKLKSGMKVVKGAFALVGEPENF